MEVIVKSGAKQVATLILSWQMVTPRSPVPCCICGHYFESTYKKFTIGLTELEPDVTLQACPTHDTDLQSCIKYFEQELPKSIDAKGGRDFLLDLLAKFVPTYEPVS